MRTAFCAPTTKRKFSHFAYFLLLFFLATHSKRETRMYFIIIFPLYKLVSFFVRVSRSLFRDYLSVAFVIHLRRAFYIHVFYSCSYSVGCE